MSRYLSLAGRLITGIVPESESGAINKASSNYLPGGRRAERHLRREIDRRRYVADGRWKLVRQVPFFGKQPGGCEEDEEEAADPSAGHIDPGRIVGRGVAGIGGYGLGRPCVNSRARGRLIPRKLGFHGAGKHQKAKRECDDSLPAAPRHS